MSLPKIFDFTNYDQYPSDPNPTTDADIQDYLKNQNTLLTALTKRLWQPQTAYKVGDIVASPDMADGLVAQCVIAGTTSDAEPQWSVSEAQVTDNTCTWIMRPAYCYGLATNTDVESAYNGNSVEATRLLSLGIVGKLKSLVSKTIEKFRTDNIATEAEAKAHTNNTKIMTPLRVWNAIDRYVTDVLVKTALTFTNVIKFATPAATSNDTSGATTSWVRTFVNNNIINSAGFKQHICVAYSGGQNGYIKLGDWLGSFILQWGFAQSSSSETPQVTITYPIALNTLINAQFSQVWDSIGEKYAGRILWADTKQIAVCLAGSNQSISMGCYVFIVGK